MKKNYLFSFVAGLFVATSLVAQTPALYLPMNGDLTNSGSATSAVFTNMGITDVVTFQTVAGLGQAAVFTPNATTVANSAYLSTGTSYSGVSGSAARSVAFWIKTNATNGADKIIGWGTKGTGPKWGIRFDNGANGSLRVEKDGGYAAFTKKLNDGAWHHVVVTYPSGGTLSDVIVYVDGSVDTRINTPAAGALATTAGTPVKIGAEILTPPALPTGITQFLDGQLSHVKVWEVTLTPAQAATDYAANTPTSTAVMRNLNTDFTISTANNFITIDNKLSKKLSVALYATSGVKVSELVLKRGLNIVSATKGIYVVMLSDAEGKTTTQKVVVN